MTLEALRSLVLIAIAVLPILVLRPAARSTEAASVR
jgi:hypothetical protein